MHEVRNVPLIRVPALRIAVHDIREAAPAVHGEIPLRIPAAVVVLLPPHLDDEVAPAVVLERRVEIEAEPGIGRNGACGRGVAAVDRDGRVAVVVVDESVGEGREGRVAERQAVIVVAARRQVHRGVPFPPGYGPGREAVALEHQNLVPAGRDPSTRGVRRRAAGRPEAFPYDYQFRGGKGRRHKEQRRDRGRPHHKTTSSELSIERLNAAQRARTNGRSAHRDAHVHVVALDLAAVRVAVLGNAALPPS